MNTEYQRRQAREMRQEAKAQVAELIELGAIAEIGVCHYPGRHSNVNTLRSIGKFGDSRCIKGDDPTKAVVAYARVVFGKGTLRHVSTTKNDDGSIAKSYLVFA